MFIKWSHKTGHTPSFILWIFIVPNAVEFVYKYSKWLRTLRLSEIQKYN